MRSILVFSLLAMVVAGSVFGLAGASGIPSWIKGVAGWWADDKISEQEFLAGIEYLIETGAIKPKIVQEQEAKIKQLEARLAELEKPPVRIDKNKELREATQMWVNGQLSDQAYYNRVQDLVNRGLIGPWDEPQEPEKISDVDKKLSLVEYREMATLWLNGGFDDSFMLEQVVTLYLIGFVDNPHGYQMEEINQIESQKRIAEVRQAQIERENFIQTVHKKIMTNAESWLSGRISDEQYLRNVIDMSGDFYKLDPQQRLQPLHADAIPKLLANQEALNEHKKIVLWIVETNQPERYPYCCLPPLG